MPKIFAIQGLYSTKSVSLQMYLNSVRYEKKLIVLFALAEFCSGCAVAQYVGNVVPVIRVVKSMPKWKPGTQRGKPVRVQFNLPVSFGLQDEDKE